MKRGDVKELHYITHLDNLKSILKRGILCHNKAKTIQRKSIADEEIQKRREKAVIPGGKRKLHDYANLYFNARNPMMFKRKDIHKELGVLRVDTAILDECEVVISDCNASTGYVAFYPSPQGLEQLDEGLVFAEYWTDPNPIIASKKKSAICAEVLVPDSVPPTFITGIYVSCEETHKIVVDSLAGSLIARNVRINPKLFFL